MAAVKRSWGCSHLGHSENKYGVTSFGSLLIQTGEEGGGRWLRHIGAEIDCGNNKVMSPLLPSVGMSFKVFEDAGDRLVSGGLKSRRQSY